MSTTIIVSVSLVLLAFIGAMSYLMRDNVKLRENMKFTSTENARLCSENARLNEEKACLVKKLKENSINGKEEFPSTH